MAGSNHKSGSANIRYIQTRRVVGAFELYDISGLIAVIRVRDDMPEAMNSDLINTIVADMVRYGRSGGIYQ